MTSAVLLLVAGCQRIGAPGTTSAPTPSAALPVPVATLLRTSADSEWVAHGTDVLEVWICHVPADTTASIYAGLPLRLPLQTAQVASLLEAQAAPYFASISHGTYHVSFVAGGEVSMSASDQPRDCVDEALDRSAATATGVFAVADAEHGGTEPGGFGSVGNPCPAAPCRARVTRRAAYIGASDFHPDWGDRVPVDLVEHEVGHLLGWMHSGVDSSGAYLSALDVMSNSAAPRDVDGERRDGPDTLGLNRLLVGWLTTDDVWSSPATGGEVMLSPSTGTSGTRLALVPLSDTAVLTVEVLVNDGWNSHLPASGVALHRVEVSDGTVKSATPLLGDAPYTDVLAVGRSLDVDGWRIEVLATDSARWQVSITRSLAP